MLTATSQFNDTIGSQSMTVTASLEIDLPVTVDFTGAITTIEIDATNTTDLPDDVRNAAGYSTLGGTVTLAGPVVYSGATITAADLFNPDNRDSPLFHLSVKNAPVRFSYGVWPAGSAAESLRKLTGLLSDMTLDHATGEVTCTLVDISGGWTDLPALSTIPAGPPFNDGLTSEFPLDGVLRSVTGGAVSSWPAQRAGCVLAAGMRTSVVPEVGTLVGTPALYAYQSPTFAPGKFGSAYAGDSYGSPVPYQLAGAGVGASLRVEGWVGLPATDPSATVRINVTESTSLSAEGAFVQMDRVAELGGPGSFFCGIESHGGVSGTRVYAGPSITDGDPHHVVALFTLPALGATAATVSLEVDGVGYGPYSIGSGIYPRATFPWQYAVIECDPGTSLEGLQISTETTIAPSNNSFVPAAVLDPSLNPLTITPDIPAGSSAWDVIQQIAAAECGYARVDENGVFRFSNRLSILNQPVQRTITSAVSLKTLTTSIGGSSQYDHVQVPWTGWSFGTTTGVWSAVTVIKVPAHSTKTWTQTLDGPAAALDMTFTLLANGHSATDGGSYYRASTDPSGVNPHPGVTVTAVQISSSQVQFTVVNPSATAYLVTPATYTDLTAGTPALWLGGVPVTAANEATVDVAYNGGSNVYQYASNPYIQDFDTATALGQYLLAQLVSTLRDFTDVAIVPDARIQIADLDLLQDPKVSGVDEYVLVWGWSFTASFPTAGTDGGDWSQTINVRALAPPDGWIGGAVPDRAEAADSTSPSWAYN